MCPRIRFNWSLCPLSLAKLGGDAAKRDEIKVTDSDVEEHAMGENLERLNENLARVEELSKRLVAALSSRDPGDVGLEGPGSGPVSEGGHGLLERGDDQSRAASEHQVEYWGKTLTHFLEMQQNLSHGQFVAPSDDPDLPDDKRFANPLWKTHPYFNFVKHQYLLGAKAIEDAVAELEGLEETDKARVEFFARQMIDLFSPTNYLATNPDALERAVETEGMSLVQGLENMVRDIESHHGELLPTLADPAAFEVGGNIATTEGSVVFRNRMMELIQYTPTTETVHRTPLVIFPPWINKFYIMDLKPQNSLIRWIVDQGYTLFVVSWKNPDVSYADVGLEQYVEEGYLEATCVSPARSRARNRSTRSGTASRARR
jgi:polyhydroxyalkanoate synthase